MGVVGEDAVHRREALLAVGALPTVPEHDTLRRYAACQSWRPKQVVDIKVWSIL